MTSTQDIFKQTDRFCKAVGIINEIDSSKLSKLVSRIAEKLYSDEKAFTKDEETKLQNAFDLSPTSLTLVLETIQFILQQAAYHSMKSKTLYQNLLEIQINESSSEVLAKCWVGIEKTTIKNLKTASFTSNQLTNVQWQFNLHLANDKKSHLKETNAVFHLGLSDNEDILLEFNHEQLLKFHDQLETIQGQLDSLS